MLPRSTIQKDKYQAFTNYIMKALVAYFSHTGNTRVIASQIHERVGGDMLEIATVNPYPSDYDECVKQAKQELEKGYRPELKIMVKDIGSYDLFFIGYPNWWGTMPMALISFFGKNDMSGKTIVPFCTHGGSRLGRSVTDITKFCPNSTVLDGLAIRSSDINNSRNEVYGWLRKLGIIK